MKIVELTQGSQGWLDWRRGGICASDIPIIMRTNYFTTILELWEVKNQFRAEPEINEAMAHGIKYEDIARQWVNKNMYLGLKAICVEDDDNACFRASLDGYDSEHEVLVEIKCPLSAKTLNKAHNQEIIHDYWKDQVLWQMMISSPKIGYVAVWDYRWEKCIMIEVEYDGKRVADMREKAAPFWESVQVGKEPK